MRRWGVREGAYGDERGAVAVLVAVFMVLLMGLAAIVIDLGFARDRSRLAQSAADAAALAAAQYLSTTATPATPTPAEYDAARTRALEFVSANGWPAGGVVSFDNARYVVTVALNPQSSPTFFAGVLGASAPSVARSAAARWADPSVASGTCSVCVFGDLDTQNGDLFVANGDVRVAGRIAIAPRGRVHATGVGNLYAGDLANSSVTRNILPRPMLQQTGAVPDPFATVPTPPVGLPITGSPSGPTCGPGTYTDVENCRTFTPGIYVLTGATKWVGNRGALGDRVLFYLTCASGGRSAPCATGEVGGSISSSGGARNPYSFTPYDDAQYRGLVVFGDRNNTAVNDIQGGSEFSTGTGSFYMRRGTLDRGGNPEVRIGGIVAVGQLAANGNPNPAYVTGTPTTGPPLPPAAGVVVLVD